MGLNLFRVLARDLYIMLLSNRLLNFIGILTIANYRSDGVPISAEADEDISLKQALFLVELLKSDFAKVLRQNNNFNNSSGIDKSTEVDDNTCPPNVLDDFNTTAVENFTVTTVHDASSTLEMPTVTSPAIFMRPGNPELPFSNWPSIPVPGYLPPGPVQQGNVPADGNFRYPYRFGRRRMMPDYYYFDSPIRSRGQFRRQESGDPAIDLAKETVTTQAQTSTNIPTLTSEVTTLRIEETSTSIFSTTMTTNTTHQLTSTELSIQPTTQSSTHTTIQPSTKSPIALSTGKSSIHTSTELSYQTSTRRPTHIYTKQSRTRQDGVRARMPPSKASTMNTYNRSKKLKDNNIDNVEGHHSTKNAYNRNEKLKDNNIDNDDGHHLRYRETTIEDVVLSQVKTELIKEFNGTESQNILFNKELSKNDSKPHLKKKLSTMKIFLKGSTRLLQPLPENNAFCHFHPNNPLCGTKL